MHAPCLVDQLLIDCVEGFGWVPTSRRWIPDVTLFVRANRGSSIGAASPSGRANGASRWMWQMPWNSSRSNSSLVSRESYWPSCARALARASELFIGSR